MPEPKQTITTVRSNNGTIIRGIIKGHIAIVIMAICPLMSCTTDTVYHHFRHTAEEGWDKRDTFYFTIDTLLREGDYRTTLCLRTDATYPYRNLSVRAAMTVRPGNTSIMQRLDFRIENQDRRANGNGITLKNHEKYIGTIHLKPGDSLTVKVAHNMRRETMPGIKDIGIKVTKN